MKRTDRLILLAAVFLAPHVPFPGALLLGGLIFGIAVYIDFNKD